MVVLIGSCRVLQLVRSKRSKLRTAQVRQIFQPLQRAALCFGALVGHKG